MTTFNFQDLVYFQEGPGILSKQFTNKGVKILNVRNIVNGNLDISNTTTFISEEEAYGKYKHFLIDGDEIIIASSGIKVEYFDKKVCFANKESLPLMLNTSIIRLKSLNEEVLLKGYLYYFLKSQIFKNQIQKLITGSAQLNFGPSHLKQIQIPLPPLSHQKQIIQKLDNLTNLINLRKLSIEKTEKLTKSIFIEMFGDPMINEKGWEVKTVIDFCDCIVPGRDKPKSFTGTIPWIKTEDLIYLGVTFKNCNNIGLTNDEIKGVRAKIVPKNSVIMTCVGDLGIISILGKDSVINQQLHSFQCSDRINNYFLMYLLIYRVDYMYKMATSTTVPYMNKTACNSIPIFIPPISLQNKFASIVEKNEENIRKQKESLRKLEELYSGVMQESFRI